MEPLNEMILMQDFLALLLNKVENSDKMKRGYSFRKKKSLFCYIEVSVSSRIEVSSLFFEHSILGFVLIF